MTRTFTQNVTLALLGLCCLAFACQNAVQNATSTSNNTKDGKSYFGEKIDDANTLSMDAMLVALGNDDDGAIATKVEGEIEAVCKVKGCWMTLKKPDGNTMRVKFKDYGFFVPLDCEGKTAVIQGNAVVDTTSIADLRHYAEDEGKSAEEIAQITEPEIAVSFEANGVILK
ncbi:MAG: DUF4920 domain-containing protein [Chitinophagales bacterium]